MREKRIIHTIIIYTDKEKKEVYGQYEIAKEKVSSILEQLNDDEIIGILWTKQTFIRATTSENFIGQADIFNIISKCNEDKSNWVTVKNAKELFAITKVDGTEKVKTVYKPEKIENKEVKLNEELLDEE